MAQERIDKVLAFLGIGTRKEVKKICRKGVVTVNGIPVKDSSEKIDPEVDELAYNGKVLHYRKHIYIMLNKPAGVVSATEDYQHKTIIDLLPDEYQLFEPFPVGRLDKDTEGLMILTNDGQFSHQVLSPKKHIDKVYYVELISSLSEDKVRDLELGVELEDGYKTMPATVKILNATTSEARIETLEVQQRLQEIIPEQPISPYCKQRLLLTIQEGKYHQIKRMAEAVGSEVVYLKRLAMGGIALDPKLPLGDCRELTEAEFKSIPKK